jgi:hypothetical protein
VVVVMVVVTVVDMTEVMVVLERAALDAVLQLLESDLM